MVAWIRVLWMLKRYFCRTTTSLIHQIEHNFHTNALVSVYTVANKSNTVAILTDLRYTPDFIYRWTEHLIPNCLTFVWESSYRCCWHTVSAPRHSARSRGPTVCHTPDNWLKRRLKVRRKKIPEEHARYQGAGTQHNMVGGSEVKWWFEGSG